MFRCLSLLLFLVYFPLSGTSVHTLYNSLNPRSIPQHLAFYENYPHTTEGQQALAHAWKLLTGEQQTGQTYPLSYISPHLIDSIISLVNKPVNDHTPLLSSEERSLIDTLAGHLPNRKLKGYEAQTEAEVIALAASEIDLSHGLFLTQLGEDHWETIRSYEAMIDLMALQLLTKISLNSPPAVKIRAINHFIFDEMGFRFPPHSIYAKDIDHYTFLPSVLDSRQGVCLGVSILYLSLAQRLDLKLEVITPPGHIYVRWREGRNVRNIETTARGIHIDSEEYLGIETRQLETHDVKEVIGMAHINQASVYLHEQRFDEALKSYQKAEPYLTDDIQLRELLGFSYVFTGDKDKGETLLSSVKGKIPPHAVSVNTLIEDYLDGAVDADGVKVLFQMVDENRSSILSKKAALESTLNRCPRFRDGRKALATTWLQLHRAKEALQHLQAYHTLYPCDPSVEYYLAVIYTQRLEYSNAHKHLQVSKQLLSPYHHHPRALKALQRHLNLFYPVPAAGPSTEGKTNDQNLHT